MRAVAICRRATCYLGTLPFPGLLRQRQLRFTSGVYFIGDLPRFFEGRGEGLWNGKTADWNIDALWTRLHLDVPMYRYGNMSGDLTRERSTERNQARPRNSVNIPIHRKRSRVSYQRSAQEKGDDKSWTGWPQLWLQYRLVQHRTVRDRLALIGSNSCRQCVPW